MNFKKNQPNLLKYFHYFVYAVIVGSIILSYSIYLAEKKIFEIKNEEKIKDQALKLINNIDESLIYLENFTNLIATKISQSNVSDRAIVSILENVKPKIDDKKYDIFTWTLFDFTNPSGRVVGSSNLGALDDENVIVKNEQRSWMAEAKLQPWKFHISKSDIGIVSRKKIIPIGFGVTTKRKKFIGIVSFGIEVEKFQKNLEYSLSSPTINFALLNYDNSVITISDNFDYKNYDYFYKLLKQSLKTVDPDSQNKFIKIDNRHFYYAKIPHYPKLSIVVGVNKNDNKAEFISIILPKILNTLYLTIFFLTLLYFFRKKLVSPVVQLSNIAHKVSQGNTKIKVPSSKVKEIEELSNAIEMVQEFVEKQQEEKNLANQANYNKTEFLASTAHELKNIIAGIIGLAELIKLNFQERISQNNEKLLTIEEVEENKGFLDDIIKLGEELSEFIHDILDVNQAQTGNFKIDEQKTVDVQEIILRSVKLLKIRAVRSKKHIVTTFINQSGDRFNVTNLDPRRMKQILVNLISNSIKYAEENSKIEVRLENIGEECIESTRDVMMQNLEKNDEINYERKVHLFHLIKTVRPQIIITIKDHGEGMSEEEVKIALQKYGRLKHDDSLIDSTGLGLPLVKHLIELQGGMLMIYSQKGSGTEVKIFL